MVMNKSDNMGVHEVAKYLGVSSKTIYKMVVTNSLPYFRVGKQLKFRRRDVDDWIEKQIKSNENDE